MDIWLSWFIGFVIWSFLVLIFAIVTFLITSLELKSVRGKLPDEIFDYKYREYILPENGFFMDLHTHTIASDGWMTPEQLIKWSIANGYNAFVLTDHNTGRNNEAIMSLQEKYPEILIIPGYEWTTWRIHINLIGIMDWSEKVPKNPSDEDIKHVIKKAKEMGAVVQVDHISWTLNEPMHRSGAVKHPTREQLLEWGIDGYEINNEMRWYDPKTLHWLEHMKSENKLPRPIYISTGTDIHNPVKQWATGWTQILLTDEERKKVSWDVIKKALLEGRTKIWVDHDYRVSYEAKKLKLESQSLRQKIFPPLFALKYGIEKIPGSISGIIMYVIWFLVAYFPLRLLFQWLVTL